MATINTHTSKAGVTTYRVRVQRKGCTPQTATFPTLKEAKRWAIMIEGRVIEGRRFPVKSTHTLNELLERYSSEVMLQKSPETIRSQQYVVAYWKRVLGHKILSDITPADIIAARNTIAKRDKPATVVKYLVILSHAFTIAIKEYQWMETNPCSRVSRPTLPSGRPRYLTDEERIRLLQECRKSKNTYLYPLVVLALHTGLRRGSLLALTQESIRLDTETLYLPTSKNGLPVILPLVGEALTLARELYATSTDGFLFPRGKGYPGNYYRRAFEHAVNRAKLEECSFHTLRHCAASYLVQAGVPLYVVSQVLSHKRVQTTQIYAHLSPDNLRDALEILANRLSS